jgi:hypothetical protein
MAREINVFQYHNEPIAIMTGIPGLPGVTWKVRQPTPADRMAVRAVFREHQKRVTDYAAKIAEEAKARAEKAERESVFCQEGQAPDPDAEARAYIEEAADEETIPTEFTVDYLNAAILAVYVTPEVEPALLLEKLGPGIIQELLLEVNQVFTGDAAKKKLAVRPAL